MMVKVTITIVIVVLHSFKNTDKNKNKKRIDSCLRSYNGRSVGINCNMIYLVIVVSSYFKSYCYYFLKTKLYFGFVKKVIVSPPGYSIQMVPSHTLGVGMRVRGHSLGSG